MPEGMERLTPDQSASKEVHEAMPEEMEKPMRDNMDHSMDEQTERPMKGDKADSMDKEMKESVRDDMDE